MGLYWAQKLSILTLLLKKENFIVKTLKAATQNIMLIDRHFPWWSALFNKYM